MIGHEWGAPVDQAIHGADFVEVRLRAGLAQAPCLIQMLHPTSAMKTRIIIISVLLCGISLLLWKQRTSHEKLIAEDSAAVPTETPPVAEKPQKEVLSLPQSGAATRNEGVSSDPRTMGSNAFYQWWLTSGQVPIDFYGKVIDENSNVIAGANVNFSWRENREARRQNSQSDVDGLFSLQNARGSILEVAVSKDGYYTPRPGFEGFVYTASPPFSPDSLNPVVFKLRKKGIPESLITTSFPGFAKIEQLRGDGTPVEIDLMNGAKVPAGNGHIKLEFWRKVGEEAGKAYNWRFNLSVLGGGVVETDQEFSFEAPEKGYIPSLEIDMPSTNQTWQSNIRRKYYIHLADGRYGRIEVYLSAWNGVFTIKSAINPSGSRNLEAQ